MSQTSLDIHTRHHNDKFEDENVRIEVEANRFSTFASIGIKVGRPGGIRHDISIFLTLDELEEVLGQLQSPIEIRDV